MDLNAPVPGRSRPGGLELLSDIARQASTSTRAVDGTARKGPPKESAEVRLQRFLEENGANNDLLIQCGATRQVLKLCPRQMYEVLTSTLHASKSQEMFARAQTNAQWTSCDVYNHRELGASVPIHDYGMPHSGRGLWSAAGSHTQQGGSMMVVSNGPLEQNNIMQQEVYRNSNVRDPDAIQTSMGQPDHFYHEPSVYVTPIPVSHPRPAEHTQQTSQSPRQNQQEQHSQHAHLSDFYHQQPKELPSPQQPQSMPQQLQEGTQATSKQPQTQKHQSPLQMSRGMSDEFRGTKRSLADSAELDADQYRGAPDDGYRWRKYGEKMCSTQEGSL